MRVQVPERNVDGAANSDRAARVDHQKEGEESLSLPVMLEMEIELVPPLPSLAVLLVISPYLQKKTNNLQSTVLEGFCLQGSIRFGTGRSPALDV